MDYTDQCPYYADDRLIHFINEPWTVFVSKSTNVVLRKIIFRNIVADIHIKIDFREDWNRCFHYWIHREALKEYVASRIQYALSYFRHDQTMMEEIQDIFRYFSVHLCDTYTKRAPFEVTDPSLIYVGITFKDSFHAGAIANNDPYVSDFFIWNGDIDEIQ